MIRCIPSVKNWRLRIHVHPLCVVKRKKSVKYGYVTRVTGYISIYMCGSTHACGHAACMYVCVRTSRLISLQYSYVLFCPIPRVTNL